MALNALGLGFVFTAKDLASGTIRRLGRNFNTMSATSEAGARRMKGAMVAATAGVGLLVAGVATLGGAFALANQAGQFEVGIAKVGAISRASAADLARLSDAAKQAGIETQFSPTEATEGLQNLAAQGFNATESIKLLKPALDLAAGGQIGIGDASATTAAAIKVFGLSAEQGAEATDKLLRITNLTALQAPDLGLALGTVSRGAIAAKQSMDEMLPAMGLVKNAGVDTSVAASSVSSALQFMAKNAKAFKQIGVNVTDAQGRFRPFLDVVRETDAALNEKFADDADKTAKAIKLFGRFGVAAFTNISNQLTNGIKDSNDQLVQGADAIKFLRNQMRNAEGAAAEFREKLLDTFEGQKTLLKGSMQTLGVELGSTFARAFKPMVSLVIKAVNAFIKIIASIPDPIKDAMAKGLLAFGAILTMAGILALGVAAATLLKAAVVALGAALLVMAKILIPLAALVGVVVLAFKGYERATVGAVEQTNVFTRAWDKLKLAFVAISALISGKPVSKDVIDDLNKAENSGIKAFVTGVGKVLNRIESLFNGLSAGFNTAFIAAKPIFDAFMEAVANLGGAFGDLGEGAGFVTKTPMEQFIAVGFRIGKVVGELVKLVVRFTTFLINGWAGVVKGVKAAFKVFGPVLDVLADSVKALFTEFGKLFDEIFGGTGTMGSGATMAERIGKVMGFVSTVLRLFVVPALILFVNTMRLGVLILRGLANVVKRVVEFVVEKFGKMKAFFNDTILPGIKSFVDGFLEFFQPVMDFFRELFEMVSQVVAKIDEFTDISGKAAEAGEAVANFFGLTTEEAPQALSLDTAEFDTAEEKAATRSFVDPNGSAFSAVAAKAATDPQIAASNVRLSAVGPGANEQAVADAIGRALSSGVLPKQLAAELRKNPPTIQVDADRFDQIRGKSKLDRAKREFGQAFFDTED